MCKYEYSNELANLVKKFLVDDESDGDINVASEEIKVNSFDGKQEGGAA